MPTLSHTLGKGSDMSIEIKPYSIGASKPYSVRAWDSLYNTWVMIPETGLTRDEAINRAIELSDEYDCGLDGTQEMEVWIDCLGMGTAQMVGYVMLDYYDDSEASTCLGWTFVECFS